MWFIVERFGAITELRTGECWPPARLAAAVRTRAAALKSLGVGRGTRVLICEAGGGSFFADLLAVWRLGACAVCLSSTTTPTEIENITDFMEPAALLVDAETPSVRLSIPCVCLANERDRDDPDEPGGQPSSLDDDALVLLTSGTTGTPKGVVHSFRGLLARLALNRQIIGDVALHRTLCLLPAHFGHGLIGNSLTPLVAGHDLVIGSDLGPSALGSLDHIVDEHAISFMSSVPATWKLVTRLCRRTPARPLTRVHVGSAPLSAALWTRIAEWSGTDDVVNAYGLTETANWVAGASARTYRPADGLVGQMWGGAAAVLREDGRLAGSGEGEIVLQTPSVMRGYYRRADLDRDTWHEGWFRTRDFGEIDAGGAIRLLRRMGQEINRGGIKVHPQDIEQLLERYEDVDAACAFAFDDEILTQGIGVAVAAVRGAHLDVDDLKAWSAARLSKDKLPDRWFVTDDIPRTERGKVDRPAVVRQCLRPSSVAT